MLNRIININTNVDLRSGPRSSQIRGVKSAYGRSTGGNDSISFSPAVNFLSRIGWKLKEIGYSGKDKIRIAFSIAEFDFSADIDFIKYYSEPRQVFVVFCDQQGSFKKQTFALTVSVIKKDILHGKEIEHVEPDALRKLFSRIAFLDIKNELSRADTRLIKGLIDEINFQIVQEFEYISSAFITLVDKLLPGNILPGRKYADTDEPVIIEKIKVVSNDR